jgi:hypothetical protein
MLSVYQTISQQTMQRLMDNELQSIRKEAVLIHLKHYSGFCLSGRETPQRRKGDTNQAVADFKSEESPARDSLVSPHSSESLCHAKGYLQREM